MNTLNKNRPNFESSEATSNNIRRPPRSNPGKKKKKKRNDSEQRSNILIADQITDKIFAKHDFMSRIKNSYNSDNQNIYESSKENQVTTQNQETINSFIPQKDGIKIHKRSNPIHRALNRVVRHPDRFSTHLQQL